jgi:hypothetical protein
MRMCWAARLAQFCLGRFTHAMINIPNEVLQAAWLISTIVATFGGVAAAFTAIYQLHQGRKQRIRELRWNQAKLAKEMLDTVEASEEVQSAFRLLDWSGYEHDIDADELEPISFEETYKALRTKNTRFNRKELFVRDCFDEFFDSLAHLEHYVASGLLLFDDVQFLFEYYVQKMSKHRSIFEGYMRAYSFQGALTFVRRYSDWRMDHPKDTAYEESEEETEGACSEAKEEVSSHAATAADLQRRGGGGKAESPA